jgi:hypothetical protein
MVFAYHAYPGLTSANQGDITVYCGFSGGIRGDGNSAAGELVTIKAQNVWREKRMI